MRENAEMRIDTDLYRRKMIILCSKYVEHNDHFIGLHRSLDILDPVSVLIFFFSCPEISREKFRKK